jgi:uncharacterized protein (TIGR00369 family)
MARVRASFARQGAMTTLGADLADVAGGRVAIALPIEPRLSQQDGFLHAGVIVAVLDSACGYAALTLMPDEAEVLTVELKVNLLAPAGGQRLVAEGAVVRAGGTLTVCRGDGYAEQGSERVHVATMLATMCAGALDEMSNLAWASVRECHSSETTGAATSRARVRSQRRGRSQIR